MNNRRFEFQNKDIPFLNKDMKVRFLFMALFLLVFVAQIASLIYAYNKKEQTTLMLIVSSVVMLVCLIFIVMCLAFAFKDMGHIQEIKKSGFTVSTVTTLPSIDKNSFIKIYKAITKFLAIVSLLVVVCGITYTALQLWYYKTFSFYLPLLFLFAIVGFNTTYHISHEIKLTETVKKFNSSY